MRPGVRPARDPVHVLYAGARCDAEGYLQRAVAYRNERPRGVWELAIADLAGGGLLGSCNLTLMAAGEADLGYMLRRDAWGRGLGTETALALIEAGFKQMALNRIISTVDVRNKASIRVLEKTGLRWKPRIESCARSAANGAIATCSLSRARPGRRESAEGTKVRLRPAAVRVKSDAPRLP